MRENFIACTDAVLPILILILLGWWAGRLGLLDRGDVKKLNKVFFRYFLSSMLFYNIYTSDLRSALRPGLIAYAMGCTLVIFFAALALASRFEPERRRRGVLVQGLYRTNLVVIGLPVVQSLMGEGQLGPVVVLSATVVPLYNVLAVIVLESYSGERTSVRKLVLDILKNPLIVSSLLGILTLLLGLRLPRPVETAVKQLSQAASPVLVFLLGAFLRPTGLRRDWRAVLLVSGGRLLLIPALTLLPAALIGWRGADFAALLPVFASSTAVTSFTMAQQMGGDAELAGNIVVATSVLCPLTLFLWCFLFKTLGVI